MGTPSSIGYGKNPYGYAKGGSPFKKGGAYPFQMDVGFGLGDWAEEVTWKIIPAFYRDEDGTEGTVPEPLRGLIDAIKPMLNELLKTWRAFPTLWDSQKVPLAQLPALAYNIGAVVDSTKQERFQRAEVLNSPLLYVNKGTDLGYQILAAFEDLLVEIVPLWAESKEPGSALTPDNPAVGIGVRRHPRDEVPLPQRGDLPFGDRLECGLRPQPVAHAQVAVELELGVRRQRRREATGCEQAERALGIDLGGGTAAFAEAFDTRPRHRPGLEHRGWRDESAVASRRGNLGVEVHRIAVVERVHPVADHREVDVVGRECGTRPTHRLPEQRDDLVPELVGWSVGVRRRCSGGHGGQRTQAAPVQAGASTSRQLRTIRTRATGRD